MNDSKKELEIMRHSAAHLAAHALLELFPQTKLTIGPPTEEGFFYDVLPVTNLKETDLALIEAKMHELATQNLPITHEQVSKQEARKLYKDNPFKLELIDSIEGDTVGIAKQGSFYDLCRGGHVSSTGQIKYFKLLNLSGSYWRGNRDGQALQRITGTAFLTEQDLINYEKRCEEAQMYDHRRLGKQLDLFSFHLEGVGFPFFHPKGKTIITVMQNYLRKVLDKAGYQEISTPIMLNDSLWKQSGHYDHYKKNMYFCDIDDITYAIKPMNCPGAILIYQERPHSYRELPLRLSEFGLVHRHELSGVLHGLFRVRAFTIDDGHIFCTPEQLEQETLADIQLIHKVMNHFGFNDITIKLATKPDDAMGSNELWNKATQALKNALDKAKKNYVIAEGDGAFYGPKLEYHIKDSMDRSWQCSTTQIDFFQPERFDLSYIASTGQKERPVMIHRAIYGSFERFLAIILEHYKGNFPLWLAPVQIQLLTITEAQKEYAIQLMNQLADHGIRVKLDESADPISGKIKTAQMEKVPWMLVIGNKEVENNTIALRTREGKQEFGLTFDQLLSKYKEQVT